MNKTILALGLIVIVGLVGISLIQSQQNNQNITTPPATASPNNITNNNGETMPNQNIVEIAAANPSFSTLVKAVTEAGLIETLSGAGPFTVFAPTDEAFAKLPAGTIEGLLADKEALTKVLTYHVVAGKVMSADVVNLTSAKTVQGQDVTVKVEDQTVKINNATVVTPDIEASNGVIHVIDTVLLPK